jgi:hypothetical protein
MKYPSEALKELADWLEDAASRVDSLEDAIEETLAGAKDRLTAYSQLQAAREEIGQLKRERRALLMAYGNLVKRYEKKTGETAPKPSIAAQRAATNTVEEIKTPIRRLLDSMEEIRRRNVSIGRPRR